MKRTLIILFVFGSLLFLTEGREVNKPSKEECRSLFGSTDVCLRKILYIGDNEMVFVKTEKMLDDHCKEIKESYKCLQKFGKCLKLFPKQVFVMTMRSVKKIIKDRCDTPRGREEFLNHTKCLRKPEIYDFNRCVDKGVMELKYVTDNGTTEELIPALCCAFQDISDCLKRKGDEYCTDYSGPETGNYVAGIARSLGKDLIELACGERNSLPKCRKHEAKWMKVFDSFGEPFSSIKPQKNSFFNPLIKLSSRLDSPV